MRTACPRLGIRTSAVAMAAGVVFVCPGVAPPALAQAPSNRPLPSAVVFWGTVSDQATEGPVAGARLQLVDLGAGARILVAESDETGSFAFLSLAAGTYELRVDRLGYEGVVDTLSLAPGANGTAEVSLVPAALSLAPVVVNVERERRSTIPGFEERRATGVGSFVTRSDIEDQRPLLVTDLLRSVSGVRVVPDARGDARLLFRGRCEPQLYIDGAAAYGGVGLDMTLRPDDVEAIEVHSTASAPVEFSRNACGVVLVWTRLPEPTEGRGSWWKGLAVAGGFLAVMVVTR